MKIVNRLLAYLLAFSLIWVGMVQSAEAALISARDVASEVSTQDNNRANLTALLDRPGVQAKLEELGISSVDAKTRVAALTDEEVAALADKLDSLPAGGDGVLGTLVFIFLVLLVTDILGLTKVFPFTHSIRR